MDKQVQNQHYTLASCFQGYKTYLQLNSAKHDISTA